jgi:hypothetical protein
MVNWIAGNWSQPWKCLVNHDGIFDARMMAYSTEELWFSEWENGGTPWDHAPSLERFNPVNHVADWREHRAVPLRAKQLATVMMATSCIGTYFFAPLKFAWIPTALCTAVAIWLWRLPTRRK